MTGAQHPQILWFGTGSTTSELLPAVDRTMLHIGAFIDERAEPQSAEFAGSPVIRKLRTAAAARAARTVIIPVFGVGFPQPAAISKALSKCCAELAPMLQKKINAQRMDERE